MARTPQVSRTFKTTEVDVLCYDLDKSEAVRVKRTVNRWYGDDKRLLDKLDVMLIGDGLRPIKVERASKHIKTMMMTEEEFLSRARVVDDRCVDDEDFDYDLDPDVMIG